MRDVGLDEAIRVAGGVGALARKIGISQPSVSNWLRVPAERVLSVEALGLGIFPLIQEGIRQIIHGHEGVRMIGA